MTFGSRLERAVESRGRLCVGIDPHPALLDAWGMTDSAVGLERFAMTAVEALGGEVAALKPQSAFFERHGSQGIAVLERLVAAARDLGALVVLDVKRGDIGSTAQAYADAYLAPTSPLYVDAVTASPFLGFGSLDPMLDTALANDAGVFVLALTSNPEGPQVQHATTAHGRTVAGAVLEAIAARNAGADGNTGLRGVLGKSGDRQEGSPRHRRAGRHPGRRTPHLRTGRPHRAAHQLAGDPRCWAGQGRPARRRGTRRGDVHRAHHLTGPVRRFYPDIAAEPVKGRQDD